MATMLDSRDTSSRSLRVQLTSQPQGSSAERFGYEPPARVAYPPLVEFIRAHAFNAFIFVVFAGTAIWIGVAWVQLADDSMAKKSPSGLPAELIPLIKLLSVPLVCLLFTWFHVWLALQMMFFPIQFVGCPRHPIVPTWLGLPINGWQGIVPRKADVMARRACARMIGNIVTVEEFMDRIEPQHFFDALEDLMGGLCFQVLEKIMRKRLPTVWSALPSSVQHELKLKVLEDTKQSFGQAMVDLKTNISSILDLQAMAVETFVNNPRMMVDMFRSVALKELVFIQRVAAVMGFVLGLVQVVFYVMLKDYPGMDYVMLPVSGLIIGYYTNLLALKMTFRPVWPHQYCNGRIIVQGVFLKRQREASQKMAELICRNVVDARAMLNYMLRSPSSTGVEKVLDIYRSHVGRSVDKSMGIAKNMAMVAPTLGLQIDEMKQDVIDFSLELLPQHSRAIEDYMDRTMKVQETLTWRLSRISPPEFESIIHPIFQDDEWILLLVGGILGVVIGLLQAWALQAL
ncbi:unnamed protein product [Symbiodinium natans]|uniref:DUF445 domain-containing protein n=1 Tax=Symbiodinium natans TaxID=878477 RepID=A0A812SFT6_9DINO|nr:unnamed protein product [Symbiodinium natans]